MIYNFLSVYGIYYPSGTIETRVKWRICLYNGVASIYTVLHTVIIRVQYASIPYMAITVWRNSHHVEGLQQQLSNIVICDVCTTQMR